MPSWMLTWDPVLLAALSACLTWAVTALGSLTVFLLPRKKVSMEPLLAASAGVMLAASFWSLLAPAIASAPAVCALPAWAVAALGFLCGGAFLALGDLAVRLLQRRLAARRPAAMRAQEQGAADSRRRCELLVWSITLHNIPEGLAIGVAFGSLKGALTPAALAAAFSVALGIGLQNFPEGAAVALPLLREGCSRRRAFFLGQLSGLVEPLAALAGAALVTAVRPLLPWALCAAAGAMVYVAAHELLPEAQRPDSRVFVTLSCLLGFAVMMVLDVALG